MKGGTVRLEGKDKEFEIALYEFKVVRDILITRLKVKYGKDKVEQWLRSSN